MSDKNTLWVEKHRPKNIQEYVFHDASHKAAIENMLEQRMIPHLLLSGVQGTGKTSLALILITELQIDPSDVLVINASKENSVEVIRNKINNFVTTFAFGAFKIVLLEEADGLSHGAQNALRSDMEEYSTTSRFILTCNYENKILPALRSRCQIFRFKAPHRDDISEFVARVLLAEKVKFTVELLDKYVAVGYPDTRSIINNVQKHSIKGKLIDIKDQSEESDYRFQLLDAIESGDWKQARTVTCGHVAPEEWEEIYTFMYQNIHRCKKFTKQEKWDEAVVIIAEYLKNHTLVSDPEINAAAMFIRLGQL